MTIQTRNENGILTVKPMGRLDSTTAGELDQKLQAELAASVEKLVIDMSGVDFISSKGLRVLVSAYRQLSGKEMVIEGAGSSVMDVFRLSGLLKVFTVHEA